MIQLDITKNEANQRLDRFLRKYFQTAPLSFLYKLIRKDVKVNGKRGKAETLLLEGDVVNIYISQAEADSYHKAKPQTKAKRQFKIVFEDENILIVEKPFGLLVHGDQNEKKNTLANQVISYLVETGSYVPRVEKTFVPSPVNRLDRNTTGLVIFGKNLPALQSLNQMIREPGYVDKYYLTIVSGNLKKELHLKDNMQKDRQQNKVTVLGPGADGKHMETIARPLQQSKNFTLVEVLLITGRTHQIRAHLNSAGYPVIGDEKYGNAAVNRSMKQRFGLSSQFLHAYKLFFQDAIAPVEYLKGREFTAALTEKMASVKEALFRVE